MFYCWSGPACATGPAPHARRWSEHPPDPRPQATPSPRPRTVSVALRKCLDAAFAQALALGHNYVGTEHLLLGLVRERHNPAARTLKEAGVTLGRLLEAGLPVPPGFVVPTAAYEQAADGLDFSDIGAVRDLADLPPALIDEIARALTRVTGDGYVAVRSSATSEDTLGATAAGQHDTFLGVRGPDQVAEAVRGCWASLWSERAVEYRRRQTDADSPAIAVLVQRLVDAAPGRRPRRTPPGRATSARVRPEVPAPPLDRPAWYAAPAISHACGPATYSCAGPRTRRGPRCSVSSPRSSPRPVACSPMPRSWPGSRDSQPSWQFRTRRRSCATV